MSKKTDLKCKCGPKYEDGFCELCCPEEYECLEEPHIQTYIEQRVREGQKQVISDVFERASTFRMIGRKALWREIAELGKALSWKYDRL